MHCRARRDGELDRNRSSFRRLDLPIDMFTCEGAPRARGLEHRVREDPPSIPLVRGPEPKARSQGRGDRMLRRRDVPCVDEADLLLSRPSGSAGGGGDEETRTPDPLLAKEMLCQLSYVPAPGGWWWAFLDSNQRPLPYQGSALTS